MTRIKINALRNFAGPRECVAWGKEVRKIHNNLKGNLNALVFAAILIVCSVAVGCSSEKPKTASSNNEITTTPAPVPAMPAPAPVLQAENKPAPKKVVHKKPATVNYTDKTYGLAFEYPRRYAIETGDAAGSVLMSSPVPMNFVAPGGVALAAVELPETGFANTDFSSAFFDVSVHKELTPDQCNEFAVPASKVAASAEAGSTQPVSTSSTTDQAASTQTSTQSTSNQSAPAEATPTTNAQTGNAAAEAHPGSTQAAPVSAASTPNSQTDSPDAKSENNSASAQGSKLMLGDLELRATEAVSGEGTRQSDAKYFHVYQNGACYEFALNVTTVASQDGLIKHVDRDKVFDKLEKILSTVKIENVNANASIVDEKAKTPTTPTVADGPAK
jgi:hypothetical protein